MIRLSLILLAAALLAGPAQADDTAFAATAGRIRQSIERDPGIPLDVSLYNDQLTYGHNVGESRTEPTRKLLDVIGPEQQSIPRFVSNYHLAITRFIASGGNAVVTTELTGAFPDGTPLKAKTALFFTIENAKITRIETWGDPVAGQKLAEYMAKDPTVIAARAKGH